MNVYADAELEMPVDPIEEMQLRTWARRNYCRRDERDHTWHHVVLDEMDRIDRELS